MYEYGIQRKFRLPQMGIGRMEIQELLSIIANGEDSTHQFKVNVSNANAIASEMAAFSNSKGGQILMGVCDDGSIAGLSDQFSLSLINPSFSA